MDQGKESPAQFVKNKDSLEVCRTLVITYDVEPGKLPTLFSRPIRLSICRSFSQTNFGYS